MTHFYRSRDRDILIIDKKPRKVRWRDRVAVAVLVCIVAWCLVGLAWIVLNYR